MLETTVRHPITEQSWEQLGLSLGVGVVLLLAVGTLLALWWLEAFKGGKQ